MPIVVVVVRVVEKYYHLVFIVATTILIHIAGGVVATAVTEICIANTIISGCLHFYSTSAFNLSV